MLWITLLPAHGSGAKRPGREKHMSAPQATVTYGFRHDPMAWAMGDDTLEAALVRTQILGRPTGGDAGVIEDAVAEIVRQQRPDGGFGDDGEGTAAAILKLADLGVDRDAEPMRAAATALERRVVAGSTRAKPNVDGDSVAELGMSVEDARALCAAGDTTLPQLAAARGVADIEEGASEALAWAADAVNGAGCVSYFDPWSFVELAASTDHPLAGELVRKQLTLILRTQDTNGGWTMPPWWPTRQSSRTALRALHRHGLLEALQAAPPLPPGYSLSRSVAMPAGDLWGLAWDGDAWWTCDEETNTGVRFSGEDGSVLHRVSFPEGAGRGLGCWDGAPTLAQGSPWEKDPKRLVRVDPVSGDCLNELSLDCLNHAGGVARVGDHTWVADSFFGWLYAFDDGGTVVRDHVSLGGPLPVGLAPHDDTLWHDDLWAPFFIRSGLAEDGQFVECVEKPFREPFAPKPYGGVTRGIGHNDEGLWVIDRAEARIVLLEATDTEPVVR